MAVWTKVTSGIHRLDRVRDQHQGELNVVEAELRRTNEAIERYLLAFEAGTLSDTHLAPRLQTLAAKTAELQHRQAELTVAIEGTSARPPSVAVLALVSIQVSPVRSRFPPRSRLASRAVRTRRAAR
jgi:hypothetical protein